MTANTERFTGRVQTYERYRMRYPAAEILGTLSYWCGLTPTQTVADIGAGTGMLSEVFLGNGNDVIAIEPNAEMRAACEPMAERFKRLTVIAAAAEQTTLLDHSVDLVTAGRAFHWFDRARALREFQRILKPGGWIVLVSASRAKNGTAQSNALEQLLLDYSKDTGASGGGHHIHEDPGTTFAGGELKQRQIDGEEALELDAFLGQTLSYSSAPLTTDGVYSDFIEAAKQLFQQYARAGIMHIDTTCWITCGRLPSHQT